MMNELHYRLLGFTPRRSFLLHSVNPTLDSIESGIKLSFPAGTKAGGVTRQEMLESMGEDGRPFASPLYWAGFVVIGNGAVDCCVGECES